MEKKETQDRETLGDNLMHCHEQEMIEVQTTTAVLNGKGKYITFWVRMGRRDIKRLTLSSFEEEDIKSITTIMLRNAFKRLIELDKEGESKIWKWTKQTKLIK